MTTDWKLLLQESCQWDKLERMKEGYSKIRNEALAHALPSYEPDRALGSSIPRIIDKVKAAGLQGQVHWRRS